MVEIASGRHAHDPPTHAVAQTPLKADPVMLGHVMAQFPIEASLRSGHGLRQSVNLVEVVVDHLMSS